LLQQIPILLFNDIKEGNGMTFFDSVEGALADPILGLQVAFHQDPREEKVNLSVGVYKTEDLTTPILRVVKKAEAFLLEHEKSKNYLPIDGQHAFVKGVGELIFGKPFWSEHASQICGFQSPGGTGALRIGAEFLKREITSEVYIPDPSWPNHRGVFQAAGMKVSTYPYYNRQTNQIEFEGLLHALRQAAQGSVILLHASSHNPTGMDLSIEQWKTICDVCAQRGLIPFFDFAYQGFGRGLEEDAEAVRLFAKRGLEILVASSYSKNFGLYAERIGALFLITSSHEAATKCASKVKTIIRTLYSNPPLHGASIISHILNSMELRQEWEGELREMRDRISEIRKQFAAALIAKVAKKDYRYLYEGSGLFSFCNLEKQEVDRLIKEYAIYMTSDGRINVAGLNSHNLQYVVNAIAAVT
jgi:aspartate/tyrosine/aromatic aminotransferase